MNSCCAKPYWRSRKIGCGATGARSSIVPADRLSDALDCLRHDTFDAILLNLSLPDSPALLDSFLDVSACAEGAPILVLADEPDENLANRLLRDGAQDVLVKSEIECAPLARAIRYAIERQRRTKAQHVAAFHDELTGVLTRDAFLKVAEHRGSRELLALVEITADRDALDPLLDSSRRSSAVAPLKHRPSWAAGIGIDSA